ncbi:hypothetical protein TRFO_13395 [Tritrichomonas foetus]|uniref:DUF4455 domain-containing protein n=1 Tax=Tritrichomonas foetus TaxID=1144522 RepID=A0A1J4KZD6_9EUKA|nr:hypothetical protein TRFO_13395 [Tritrichomonas foetus]|eukprot:OHT16224.1 hypothetical protein TRFO_13395 [Tritrichomonas foetus]
MNETANLPASPQVAHSEVRGALRGYQERLTEKYNSILYKLEATANSISSETSDFILEQIREFFSLKNEISETRENLIQSLSNTNEEFFAIKEKIENDGNLLINKAIELRNICIERYDASFLSLQPFIDEAFDECKDFRMQLPDPLIEKLPFLVKRLNRKYLSNKKVLLEKLFLNEFESRESLEIAIQKVSEGQDAWRNHLVDTLNNDAKVQLDYHYPIDFETIYEDFARDEQKFILCFKKNFDNFQTIAPPEKFKPEDLTEWKNEVDEILELHQNFVNQFKTKIEAKIHEREEKNVKIIENIQERLKEWKTEEEIEELIAWLKPIKELTTKVNTEFVKRLNKYWNNRTDSLKKIFDHISEFISNIMNSYYGFNISVDEDKEKCKETIDEFDKEMQQKVTELEEKVASQVETINNAVNEKEIENLIESVKSNLTAIEDQYREFYTKSIAALDERPGIVNSFFETREKELLELMKLSKTVIESNTSNKGTAKNSATNKKDRRPTRQKEKKVNTDGFSFNIGDNSKFEETEILELIPETPEYEDTLDDDEDDTYLNTKSTSRMSKNSRMSKISSARGKSPPRGRSPPKKPPPKKTPAKKPPPKKGAPGKKGGAGKKGQAPEPEELEMPELKLFEMVPQINHKPAIAIYIPQNSEISDFVNPLRQAIFAQLHGFYTHASQDAEYTELRQQLVEQLNERLRVHAPRAGSMDLNVGQARLSQLDKTKRDIELHFRQTVLNFNTEYKLVTKHLDDRNDKIKGDCEKLKRFIELLNEQKQSKGFNQLQAQLKLEEKKFNSNYEQFNEITDKEINTMMTNYNNVNERFNSTISTFSNEEKEYCQNMTNKMNSQVNELFNQLNAKVTEIRKEIENQRDSIDAEFEELLPIHKSDVVFIESLRQALNSARVKYDSLKYKNKQSDNEVTHAIEILKNAITDEVNNSPENAINRQFEALDLVRLLIVKRSKYLGILKSKISAEPILVNIDFSIKFENDDQPNSKKKLTRKNSKNRKSVKVTPTDSSDSMIDFDVTLHSQIAQIGNDLLDEVNSHANPYYRDLKKRTLGITRKEEICEDLKSCQAKIKEEWNKITEDSKEIIAQSSEKVTHQMNESVRVARDTISIIYQNVSKHFNDTAIEYRKDIQESFEKELEDLSQKLNQLKLRLVPSLSDANRDQDFKDLMKEEIDREIEEKKAIDSFIDTVMDSENIMMKSFLIHLPTITRYCLQMFDSFVMTEDLEKCKMVQAERVSMKQMLMNMKRKEGDAPFSENRPAFRMRKWPQLNACMPSMDFMTAVQNPRISDNFSRKTKKAYGAKKTIEPAACIEKLIQLESLDTGLSRGAIVEQEKCYELYEAELSERIETCRAIVDEYKAKAAELNQNWRQCSLKLKPNYIFEPV